MLTGEPVAAAAAVVATAVVVVWLEELAAALPPLALLQLVCGAALRVPHALFDTRVATDTRGGPGPSMFFATTQRPKMCNWKEMN